MPTWIAIIISPFIAAALGGLGWLLIWIGSVREHKSEVTKLMHEIRIDIKKILGRTRSKLMEGASPLTLNEKGRIVSEQIAATEWAEQVAKEFTDKIQGKEEFEIEQLAFDYVNDVRLQTNGTNILLS